MYSKAISSETVTIKYDREKIWEKIRFNIQLPMAIVLNFLCDILPRLHYFLSLLADLVVTSSSSHIWMLKETGKTSLTILIDKFVLNALVP